MEQQAYNPSSINLRSKGVVTTPSGKLHRGCVKDATSKLSIGSIPATYESIIYRTESKRAFGTQSKRFHQVDQAEKVLKTQKSALEGGLSNNNKTFQSAGETEETIRADSSTGGFRRNFNREGHGAFISKVKRDCIRSVKTPGPAHYHREYKRQKFLEDIERKCKTRQKKMRTKATPLDKDEKSKENADSPGPGQYLFDRKQVWKRANKGWKSSFETKVHRDGYIPESLSPGPAFYNKDSDSKDKTKEKLKDVEVVRQAEKNVLDMIDERKIEEPGPGWYNHDIPNFKPLYEKIKMSGSFMTPIFGGKKRYKPSPGPTLYDVKRIYDNITPKLIESTPFMSETRREAFKPVEIYGANLRSPDVPSPKNFHFNIKDEWMC